MSGVGEMPTKVHCSHCDKRFIAGSSFCPHCGHPTIWATADERIRWEVDQWRSARGTRTMARAVEEGGASSAAAQAAMAVDQRQLTYTTPPKAARDIGGAMKSAAKRLLGRKTDAERLLSEWERTNLPFEPGRTAGAASSGQPRPESRKTKKAEADRLLTEWEQSLDRRAGVPQQGEPSAALLEEALTTLKGLNNKIDSLEGKIERSISDRAAESILERARRLRVVGQQPRDGGDKPS